MYACMLASLHAFFPARYLLSAIYYLLSACLLSYLLSDAICYHAFFPTGLLASLPCMPSAFCYLLSAICYALCYICAMCYLLSAICYVLSAICYLLSAICYLHAFFPICYLLSDIVISAIMPSFLPACLPAFLASCLLACLSGVIYIIAPSCMLMPHSAFDTHIAAFVP